jgi:hypothetical protein
MCRRYVLFLALILCVTLVGSEPALAICKDGVAPDYNDISAVMFERRGDGCLGAAPSWLRDQKVTDFKCSNFWLFAGLSPKALYTQYNLSGSQGTYNVAITLKQMVAVLRKHNFFMLSGLDEGTVVSDVRETVLTVRRCGVVTRLLMYPIPSLDPSVGALFGDFDALVLSSKKVKTNSQPTAFPYNIFEGQ